MADAASKPLCFFSPGAYVDNQRMAGCLPAEQADGDIPNSNECSVRSDDQGQFACDVNPNKWIPSRIVRKYLNDTIGYTSYLDNSNGQIEKFIEDVASIMHQCIPSSRLIKEGEFGLRRKYDVIGAVTEIKRSLEYWKKNAVEVGAGRFKTGRKYAYLSEPTTGLPMGHGSTQNIKKAHNSEIMYPRTIAQLLAPRLLSWVVLWWSEVKDDLRVIKTHFPLPLIRTAANRVALIEVLKNVGTFDERTHTYTFTYSDGAFPRVGPSGRINPEWLKAMDKLMYIEVEFNAACLPVSCKMDAIEIAIDVEAGSPGHMMITTQHGIPGVHIELVANMISTVFRNFSRTQQLPNVDSQHRIRIDMNGVTYADDVDTQIHNRIIQRAVNVVFARYYCMLAARDLNGQSSATGSNGIMAPPFLQQESSLKSEKQTILNM